MIGMALWTSDLPQARTGVARACITCFGLLVASLARAGERVGDESRLIVEIGGAGERDQSEGRNHFGPAVGVEIEPIENWLEIEFRASRVRSGGSTVVDLDLPLKKPFRLSETIEIMPGLGPTLEHTNQGISAHSLI